MDKVFDRIKLRGNLTITLMNLEGEVLEKRETTNQFVNEGKNLVLSRLSITTPAEISYCAIGTGSRALSADSGLLDEERGRRTVTDPGALSQKITFSAFFEADYPDTDYTFAEAGLFGGAATDTVETGTMVCAASFADVQKLNGQHTLQIDYELSM
jgi:hypothetical protein